jgi:hypothetical protein
MSRFLALSLALLMLLAPMDAPAAEWAMYCRYFTSEEQPYIDLKFRMYDHETFYNDVEVTFLEESKTSKTPLELRPPDGEELYAIDIGPGHSQDTFSLIILDDVVDEIAGIEQWPSRLWSRQRNGDTFTGSCFAVQDRRLSL